MSETRTPRAPGAVYMSTRDFILRLTGEKNLGPGDKLPPERELAEAAGCTRITLREALSQLEHEGLIYRRIRQGWFMAPPPLLYDPSQKVNFYQLAQEQKRDPATKLISAERISSPVADVRAALDLKQGEAAIEVVRCRYLDGRAVLYEEIYFGAETVEGLLEQNLERSVTSLLSEHYGIEITDEHTRLRSGVLDKPRADTLEVAQGSPCLYLTRHRLEGGGKPIEFNREYWLHNAIEISVCYRAG